MIVRTLILLSALLLPQPVLHSAEKRILPYRWVMVRTGLRDDRDVEKIRAIVETASRHGLNGMLLGAGLDTIDLAFPII